MAGTAGVSGCKDGPALEAQLNAPNAIAADNKGALYFCDAKNFKIRSLKDGMVTTVAGTTRGNETGDALTSARFSYLRGIAVEKDGLIFVSIFDSNKIKYVRSGSVSNFIESYYSLSVDRSYGIALSPDGALYAANRGNNTITVKMHQSGSTGRFAGSGSQGFANGTASSANFNNPHSVAVGPDGAVYVADTNNHRVRMIKDGFVTTIAGTGAPGLTDGPALQAQFKSPSGIAVDSAGTIYVADNDNCIRVIKDGTVGTIGCSSDGPASMAKLRGVYGICVTHDGMIYFTEEGNHLIRQISISTWWGRCLVQLIESDANNTKLKVDISLSKTVHYYLAELRCSMLLKRPGLLKELAADDDAKIAFLSWVYTDHLPQEANPRTWLGLAV